MTKPNKKYINEETSLDYYTDLNGSLEMMQKRIAEWIARYGPDAILAVDMKWDTLVTSIKYTRLETDDEYTKRIDRAKKAKLSKEASRKRSQAQQQAEELKLYKKLKKKYG